MPLHPALLALLGLAIFAAGSWWLVTLIAWGVQRGLAGARQQEGDPERRGALVWGLAFWGLLIAIGAAVLALL